MTTAADDNAGWLPGYRGYVDHGVMVPDYVAEENEHDGTTPGLTEYESAAPETDPIAVKIISDPTPRSRKDWRVTRMRLHVGRPVLLAGLNEKRTKLEINASGIGGGTGTFFLAPDSNVSKYGFDFFSIGSFTTSAVTDVWGQVFPYDDGTAPDYVDVTIVSEYEVDI